MNIPADYGLFIVGGVFGAFAWALVELDRRKVERELEDRKRDV